MSSSSEYLDEIRSNLQQGKRQWRRVDRLLGAFGYVRRRQSAIDAINKAVGTSGLQTVPVLTTLSPLESTVTFRLLDQGLESTPPEPEPTTEEASAQERDAASLEAAYTPVKIENLISDTTPEGVLGTASIGTAITQLELNQGAPLVVLDGHKKVRGIVSFRSILRAKLDGKAETVEDCIEMVPEMKSGEPLGKALLHFFDHDAVAVLDDQEKVHGLVTIADFAKEFRNIAEPFLLIGEIESRLRWTIQHSSIDVKEVLEKVEGDQQGEVRAPIELTLGQMQRIVEDEEAWEYIAGQYDRKVVVKNLETVRGIRNKVMHFRGSLEEGEAQALGSFRALLQRMCEGRE